MLKEEGATIRRFLDPRLVLTIALLVSGWVVKLEISRALMEDKITALELRVANTEAKTEVLGAINISLQGIQRELQELKGDVKGIVARELARVNNGG